VPHITLKSIANNAEIDVIWDRMQPAVEDALAPPERRPARPPTPFKVETGGRAGKDRLHATGEVKLPSGEPAPANGLMEWEIPREARPTKPARLAKPALAENRSKLRGAPKGH
jgi:adenine-specific DNA-methyltransferase